MENIKHKIPFDVGLFDDDFIQSVKSIKSPTELTIKKIEHSYANNFVLNHHYLRRKIYIARNVSYGLFIENNCIGVAMYGYPVWREYPGLCPPFLVDECPELIRLCTIDDLPKNTSSNFLARTIKMMKIDWFEESGFTPKCITSFCDLAHGFNGAIYRATNFDLLRITEGRATNAGGKHGKWGGNNHQQKAKKAFYIFYFEREQKKIKR